jgi:ABC-type Na+ efflux pump permease subunit
MPEPSPLLPILQVATTFSVFGLYYFVFGLFAVLGLIMLGIILMAEPDPQYDISEIMGPDDDSAEQTES